VPRRRGVADRNAAEIPWDVSEFVDLVGIGDDVAYRAPPDAVKEVLASQRGRARHDDCAKFHNRQHRFPQLDLIAQHDHDPIAGRDAAGGQRCSEPIGAFGHLGEGVRPIGPVFTDDAQRRLRVPRRDRVEPVECPIESVPDLGPAEGCDRGVVVVAVSHQHVADSAVGCSSGCSVHRSVLLTSVLSGKLALRRHYGADGDPKEAARGTSRACAAVLSG
jgi:hypothetical protein